MQRAFSLTNNRGMTIRGTQEWYGSPHGTPVILAHGMIATHNQPQIREVAKMLARAGFVTFRFSATNNVGSSQGHLINFTVGGFVDDMRSVVEYALSESRHATCDVVGYSLGGMVATIVAADDARIKHVAVQAPTYDLKKEMERTTIFPPYRLLGWTLRYSHTLDRKFKLGFHFYEEGILYDMRQYVARLHAPTLIAYGTRDKYLRHANFSQAFQRLGGRKKIVRIPGAGHTFRRQTHIVQFADCVTNWFHDNA